MAARLRPRIAEEVRKRIKAVQIINFLQKYALTGKDTGEHDVNPARVQAARILLDKSIPSLSQIQGAGEDGSHKVVHRVEVEIVRATTSSPGKA